MHLIHYTYFNSEYFRDDEKVSKDFAETELNKYQLNKLIENGKCNIRAKEVVSKIMSDDELYRKNSNSYRLIKTPYKQLVRLGIERLNKRYGYYNFVTYIDSEDEYIQAVINDIKEQAQLQLQRKQARKAS